LKALITGVQGQDGHYLSRLLLDKDYEVVGTRRGNDDPLRDPPGVEVVFGDVSDAFGILDLIEREQPNEVYNLAAITHVGDSFSAMAVASAVNYNGACNVAAACARTGAKFYQASTSELFGDSPPPQDESTPMRPRSPYAVAKLGAYWATRNFRDRGLFACNGILFNHESPLRGDGFVTQKVAKGVAAISRGEIEYIELGNLNAKRDWGHATDFVEAMWLMMQQPISDDYVVATGEMRSIGELCDVAFHYVGIRDWGKHVRVNPRFFRPLEVEQLCGEPAKIARLGWKPKVSFDQLVKEMVDAALER
jgi:GDPmannose 4,6-dehydratase